MGRESSGRAFAETGKHLEARAHHSSHSIELIVRLESTIIPSTNSNKQAPWSASLFVLGIRTRLLRPLGLCLSLRHKRATIKERCIHQGLKQMTSPPKEPICLRMPGLAPVGWASCPFGALRVAVTLCMMGRWLRPGLDLRGQLLNCNAAAALDCRCTSSTRSQRAGAKGPDCWSPGPPPPVAR